MHVVCGNLTDVQIENNEFIVNVSEEYSYNFIMEGNNYTYLTRALTWQGINLVLKIKKIEKKLDKTLQDISKLKNLIQPQYLVIKGE